MQCKKRALSEVFPIPFLSKILTLNLYRLVPFLFHFRKWNKKADAQSQHLPDRKATTNDTQKFHITTEKLLTITPIRLVF